MAEWHQKKTCSQITRHQTNNFSKCPLFEGSIAILMFYDVCDCNTNVHMYMYGSHFQFSLCSYVMYILAKNKWFLFSTLKPHFLGKKHQGYSSRFFQKWGFQVGNEIEPFHVRMYAYMSWMYIPKITVTACLFMQ